MALTDSSNGMFMPVAPAYMGGMGGGSGFGGWGDGWWVILFLFALMGNGWGNGFGGGNGGGSYGAIDFPWLLNGQAGINTNTNNGFRDAMINDNITSVRDGISSLSTQLCGCCGDIQNSLCNGFAGVNATVNGAQNALAQQLYTNQIADMERSFNAQTASSQGMNAIQSQLAQCCCDNRLATNDVKYTIATEECATRQSATANTQAILDKLCQLELDGYKRENDNLRSQLTASQFANSQTAQTARILQGQNDEIDALYNRLSNCPVPSTPVYGRQPIFTCPQSANSCGCGCGNF